MFGVWSTRIELKGVPVVFYPTAHSKENYENRPVNVNRAFNRTELKEADPY